MCLNVSRFFLKEKLSYSNVAVTPPSPTNTHLFLSRTQVSRTPSLLFKLHGNTRELVSSKEVQRNSEMQEKLRPVSVRYATLVYFKGRSETLFVHRAVHFPMRSVQFSQIKIRRTQHNLSLMQKMMIDFFYFVQSFLSFLPTTDLMPSEFGGEFGGSAAAARHLSFFTELKMLHSLKMQLFLDDKFPFSPSPGRRWIQSSFPSNCNFSRQELMCFACDVWFHVYTYILFMEPFFYPSIFDQSGSFFSKLLHMNPVLTIFILLYFLNHFWCIFAMQILILKNARSTNILINN